MNRAYVESLLVGVALPAGRGELIDYARRQDGGAQVAELLRRIPDREYGTLQDVGEELEPRQPEPQVRRAEIPREDSDVVPGGPAYVGRPVEPGNVAALRGDG